VGRIIPPGFKTGGDRSPYPPRLRRLCPRINGDGDDDDYERTWHIIISGVSVERSTDALSEHVGGCRVVWRADVTATTTSSSRRWRRFNHVAITTDLETATLNIRNERVATTVNGTAAAILRNHPSHSAFCRFVELT